MERSLSSSVNGKVEGCKTTREMDNDKGESQQMATMTKIKIMIMIMIKESYNKWQR